MKVCTMCKKQKKPSDFRKVKRLAQGLDVYCKDCRRSYSRQWSRNNAEKELERYRLYREKNKEVIRERSRLRMQIVRLKNPEKSLFYTREYRRNNPAKANAWDEKKRAIRKGALEAHVLSAEDWIKIKKSYNGCCVYCLKPSKRLEKDHVIPLSKGGTHTFDNIVPACKSCNSSKNARDVFDWVQRKHGRLI